MGGQDGLAEGLAVGLATGEDWATETCPPAGTAALAELNCKATPAIAPNANPPVMAATFVIFIVAGTTRATYVLVRNDLVCKLCITNWSHEPFLRPSVAAPTSICLGAKKVVCGARRW